MTRGPVADGAQTYLALLDAMPEAALLTDREGRVRHVNRAARQVLGAGADEVVGLPVTEALFDERGRGAFEDVLRVVRIGGSWEGELAMTPHHGVPQQTRFAVRAVAEGDEVVAVLVCLSQATSGPSGSVLSARLTRLARVAGELVVADSIDAVTRIVVEHMAEAAGATIASLSLLVDDETLVLAGVRGGREGTETRWATFSVHAGLPATDAVLQQRMLVFEGAEELDRAYPHLDGAAVGERSVACLPLSLGSVRVGVATLSFPGRRSFPPAELEFLSVMADTCAQAIERVRATDQAADRSAKIQFLADSSLELSSSLDYEATLSTVAWLAVPWFADWCSISLDQDGELRTLAIAHVDPGKIEVAQELQRRFPADPAAATGNYHVLRSGESELTADITDEMIDAAVADPDHRRLLRELNLRSALTVPLRVQDRVFGVITWVAGDAGRRFTEDDRVFGEDLARRGAQAIETARLHSELSEVAARLQRAILPAELPVLPGWQTAASYLQAGHSDAGGDFYDVTALGDGRLAVFVGDVMGRGVTAAAAMAQMRAAIRALVAVEPDPRTVLVALDRLFEQYDFQQLVTMVYAVFDPARDELVVANAGHPPPLVRRASGAVEVVAAEPGLLLGAGGGDRDPVKVAFGDGDLFLGYTDGLVERRDEDIDAGVRRLADACGGAAEGDLLGWLADVVLAMRDPSRDDDVAVLAVRRTDG